MKIDQSAFDAVFESVNRSETPGVVVGVAQHGNLLYRRGFGLASIEHGVINTPSTRMRIGSTSKHFTCLAALLLQEEGKLDIDASVRVYIPELPNLKGEPSLRQLMTHSSGYRCFLDLGFLANGMAMVPNGGALAAQIRQTDVNFEPGKRMLYCNGGYHLLSEVIERVSGEPFEQVLQERIFEPLGMIDTQSIPSDMQIHPRVATLHIKLPDGRYRRGIFPTEENRGEGAMVSTVDDMLRWLAHLRGPKLVGRESTWREMLGVAQLEGCPPAAYAMGLFRHFHRGVEVIHHPGSVLGGNSQMLTIPAHALDIIIMGNGAAAKPAELAYKIVDLLLAPVLAPCITLAATDRFSHLVGRYYHAHRAGFLIGFEDLAGKLGVSLMNEPAVTIPEHGEHLRLGFEDAGTGPISLSISELHRDAEGDVPGGLRISETGHVETFERVADGQAVQGEVERALAGRYHADDLDADARIACNADEFNLKIFGAVGTAHMSLQRISDSVYGLKMLDPTLPLFGVLKVDREGSQIAGFRVSTVRTRNIRFSRIDS
jgi:D-aminopeptidase